MSYFVKEGNTYRVSKKEALDICDQLPAGNYVIKQNEMTGQLYLEHIEDFTIPSKIYGDCLSNTDRMIQTFLDRENATGVMLTGEKGSGKTLLSKNISVELAKKHKVPTIVINAPWTGDKFNTFLQSIEQPCVVLFDEFEKVYDRDEQESILTLLDGVFPSKKLFMLTCNDKYRVDFHMRNRPGRIYYMMDFTGLDVNFIREYCNDRLVNKEHIEKIVNITSVFSQFNFDMLKALVEEMNRYNETPQEALRMLNVKPEFDSGTEYTIEVFYKNELIKKHTNSFNGNPLQAGSGGIEIYFDPDPNNEDVDSVYQTFTPVHLTSLDSKTGKFTFQDKDTKIVLTRVKEPTFRFYDAF
jgi:hypothetical protein